MTAELFTKVIINEEEKQEIINAIQTMRKVVYEYEKSGLESVKFLVEDLNDGISALKGVLEGLYY